MNVEHKQDENRFVANTEWGEGTLNYRMEEGRVVFVHTEVPSEAEGKGVGSALVRHGLNWARGENLEVVPQCPFVRNWIKSHEEYADLVAS